MKNGVNTKKQFFQALERGCYYCSYKSNRVKGIKVRIPSNLSISATMNTSDQNVFTLDTAFQRRWKMQLIENSFDNVRASLAEAQILDTEVTWRTFCERINSIIVKNKAKMASAEDKRLGVYFVHESDLSLDQAALPTAGYESLVEEFRELCQKEIQGNITSEQNKRLAKMREAIKHYHLSHDNPSCTR